MEPVRSKYWLIALHASRRSDEGYYKMGEAVVK
jgi:hypothetical protein